MTDKPAGERTGWLDRKENVTTIVRALYVVCGLVLLADLFARNHPETQLDAVPFFWGVYGFVGSVLLVLAAKQLRKAVKRPEDYYDD